MNGIDRAAPYRDAIVSEVCYALGAPRRGAMHGILAPLLRLPVGRFARLAARVDDAVERGGLSEAARGILPDLSLHPAARGADEIPAAGPLLIVSNHPGVFDSVAILACLPRRDVKVVLSDAPFFRVFAAARRWFIFAPLNAAGGAKSLRACLEHLAGGGALLIFANGDVEPDPASSPGADRTFANWSRSVEIMLRRVPRTRLQAAIASGVMDPKFLRSPLTRLRKDETRRQKLAEVLQIMSLMISPRSVRIRPRISFARPVPAPDLEAEGGMPAVIAAARRLYEDHLASLGTPGWREIE
ncbi:MAG: 1-acyl-sn-glycerol-3-phosphate acyltransferase [Acidobacteriota bacterium]|nr:1-acyl-sn-glycerol-3-phosphate acyltransferase [Acidobacteriota bacterium]